MSLIKNNILNREISWLHFNARVLQEAADASVPLFERIKFLGIYSNNLDEFYRVRVATITRMQGMDKRLYRETYFNPRKVLKEINKIDQEHQKIFLRIYTGLVQELADNHIFLLNENQLSPGQGEFVRTYFEENVRSRVFPIMLNNLETSALNDRSMYLAVSLKKRGKAGSEKYALLKVPVGALSRFVILPEEDGKKYLMLLDDVIRYCLDEIFGMFGFNQFKAYAVKFTRDSELDIDNNDVSKSFVEIISESLKQREVGMPVRLTYDKHIQPVLLEELLHKLKMSKLDTLVPSGKYHNFKDFMYFPGLGLPQFAYLPARPLPHPAFSIKSSILSRMKQGDILLHYPYQSFQPMIDLLREASLDPKVRAIKMTLYRLASNSNVVNALISAARNGKEVIVFLELQARFDEEANIYWAEKMQQDGIKVLQAIPGFKVHAKLLLIRRREENEQNVYYAAISTGNFNENTAKVYADTTLFTTQKEITEEVNQVFHFFDDKYILPKTKHLILSPISTRNYFVKQINKEIENAKKGKEAWMILKLNSLVDDRIIKKLYQASKAGVKVQLIVRGMCVLIPQQEKLSENIEAVSIVDRFLEHARVLVFCNGGDEKYYISSADWMVRNFDHRIEVSCPIYDEKLQKELMKMLQIQLSDNTKARLQNGLHDNEYKFRLEGEPSVRSQKELYELFKSRVKD